MCTGFKIRGVLTALRRHINTLYPPWGLTQACTYKCLVSVRMSQYG